MTTVYPPGDHRVKCVVVQPYWASDGQEGWTVTATLRSSDAGGKQVAAAAKALAGRLGGWWIVGRAEDGRIVLRASAQDADFREAWKLAGDIIDSYRLDG